MSWFSSVTSWWTGEAAPPAEPVLKEEEKDEMVPEEQWVKDLGYDSVLKRGEPDDIHKEPKEIVLEPHARKFVVRSKDYLESKVKVVSGPSLLRYAASDLIMAEGVDKLRHVCEFPSTLPQMHPERRFIVINWQLPGSPPFSYVVTYVFPNEEERAAARAAMNEDERAVEENAWNLLEKFVSEDPEVDDTWRNSRFKLIPQIVEGPWYVRTVTPSNVPALIGNKLTTTYIRGENYFELDVDITSSIAANTIWSVVSGVTTSLVIDLAFVIQGNTPEELPEQVFGTVRLSRIALNPDLVRVVVPTKSQVASPAPATSPDASEADASAKTPAVPETPVSTPVSDATETTPKEGESATAANTPESENSAPAKESASAPTTAASPSSPADPVA